MQLTNARHKADRRKMKAYIARLLPEEGTRIVLGDGEGGEIWAELSPIRYDDGEWDVYWETNEPDLIDLPLIYDHFRRQEKVEWTREQTGEFFRQRIQALEKEAVVRPSVPMVPEVGRGRSLMGSKTIHTSTPETEQAKIGSPGTLLDMKDAAKRIGCSVSGLRKLVANRLIKFFRTKKWGRIKFRVEWLEEFIAKGVVAPRDEMQVSVKKPKQPGLNKGRSRHGFDSSLYGN